MSTKNTAARPTAGSREIPRLIDQLERAYAGDAWLGMPVRELLGGVEAGAAAVDPVHDEDWPATPPPTLAAWDGALAALRSSHERLVAAVRRLNDNDLDGPAPG